MYSICEGMHAHQVNNEEKKKTTSSDKVHGLLLPSHYWSIIRTLNINCHPLTQSGRASIIKTSATILRVNKNSASSARVDQFKASMIGNSLNQTETTIGSTWVTVNLKSINLSEVIHLEPAQIEIQCFGFTVLVQRQIKILGYMITQLIS